MKLADTCVWIELLSDTTTGRRYRPLFDDLTQIVVPTLVQFELRRWALREASEDAADLAMAALRGGLVLPLDEPTALHAAALSQAHGLASMDALIYASALRAGAVLVTCDAHFKGLPLVEFQPKAGA